MLIPLGGAEPLYRQIYGSMRSAILSGQLASGTRLPSTRSLAEELGVSRTVVLVAYDQLMAEGYIRGERGSGTIVCDGTTEGRLAPRGSSDGPAVDPPLSGFARRAVGEAVHLPEGPSLGQTLRYDFHYGSRRGIDFPRRLWQRLASRRMRDSIPTGSSAGGYEPLRRAIAAYLGRARAVHASPEQVVIVSGSQQGLDLLARLLVDPGDTVVIEEPHYHGARQAFRAVGATLLPCPVDADGLVGDGRPAGPPGPSVV
jgi:GntR family transcriptional regulator/MocR family aminotransferase